MGTSETRHRNAGSDVPLSWAFIRVALNGSIRGTIRDL